MATMSKPSAPKIEEPEIIAEGMIPQDENIKLEDLKKEELIELVMHLLSKEDEEPKKYTYIAEPLLIDDEEIETSQEFIEGLLLGYELVGFYTALINGGVSKEVAQDMIVNHHTYKMSGEIVKEQSKIARKGSIAG